MAGGVPSTYQTRPRGGADSFPAFSAKIGDLFLGFKPDKLAKSINLGADLFNSVPQDDM
jgi:hypothetical protein